MASEYVMSNQYTALLVVTGRFPEKIYDDAEYGAGQ